MIINKLFSCWFNETHLCWKPAGKRWPSWGLVWKRAWKQAGVHFKQHPWFGPSWSLLSVFSICQSSGWRTCWDVTKSRLSEQVDRPKVKQRSSTSHSKWSSSPVDFTCSPTNIRSYVQYVFVWRLNILFCALHWIFISFHRALPSPPYQHGNQQCSFLITLKQIPGQQSKVYDLAWKEDASTAGLEHRLQLSDSDSDVRASSDNRGDS